MNDGLVKQMVNRFLQWKLPDDFHPDGGVTFQKVSNAGTPYEYKYAPVGTNLLTATQAEQMIRHMLEGLDLASPEILAVIEERHRQINVEGWTPRHDDEHTNGELARAAAVYAAGGGLFKISSLQTPMQVWPYQWEYKPADRRRELVKAGALIPAEIERLDRAEAREATAAAA